MTPKTVGPLVLVALFLMIAPGSVRAASPLVDKARAQIGVTTGYDPAYRKLRYPGGDVPAETGVCSDVVVRAFRGIGIDLQVQVHEDMRQHFNQYPRKWGLKAPDASIDHRRVPNLMTYFQRQGWSLPISTNASNFKPGDIVVWDLGKGITHIGIVSDRARNSTALVIHNIGQGVQEEDLLFRYPILGHYRPKLRLPATHNSAASN